MIDHYSPRSVALPRNVWILFLAKLIHATVPHLLRYESVPRMLRYEAVPRMLRYEAEPRNE